jgi:hypothetical protein
MASITCRKPWEGTAIATRVAPVVASSRLLVARRLYGSRCPGRYSGFSEVALIASANSVRRDHRTTECWVAARAATAVPQEPAPITAT